MPTTGRKAVVLRVLVLLLVAPALFAQQGGTGSIIGELQLSRGDFPGRVFVELQFRGAPIASLYTDDQGKFGFNGLESNPYHIVIRDERFNQVDTLVVLDTTISSLQMARINLVPRQTASKEPLPNRAPGSNPYLIDPSDYRLFFPKKAIKEFDKGVAADNKKERDEAIRHYENALKLAPDFYPAHNNLGSDYLSKSDFASAQEHFERAIKLNQSDSEAHFNFANLLLMTKKYDLALSSVQEGLKRQPTSPLGQYLLGSVYEHTGKLQEAEQALHTALRLDPQMSRVHLELVNVYLTERKLQEARKELRAFLKDAPNDPLAAKAREVLSRLETAR